MYIYIYIYIYTVYIIRTLANQVKMIMIVRLTRIVLLHTESVLEKLEA